MPITPAKPERNCRYSIEVNDSVVRVIKLNGAGVIINAASVPVEGLPEAIDKEYVKALSRIVKKASRAAKVPIGFGIRCVVVTGGPRAIIRRFTWPEMNNAALKLNAVQEITPFLPGDPADFTVHHRILRKVEQTDMAVPTVDIIVAAIPTEWVRAVAAAVRSAGFYIKHLDVRENARGKLLLNYRGNVLIENSSTEGIPEDMFEEKLSSSDALSSPGSYAVLDIINPQINISLYIDGMFYSNRYFTTPVKDGEPFDTDGLANEISSIIDYMQYRERGSGIQCIFLMGEESQLPGITQSLTDNLEVPLLSVNSLVKNTLVRKKKKGSIDFIRYLDAFGAMLPPSAGMEAKRFAGRELNLVPVKKPNPAVRAAISFACAVLVLVALVFAGVMIPLTIHDSLKIEEARLKAESSRYIITSDDVANLTNENALLTARLQTAENFYLEYPQASAVLPAVFALGTDGHVINSISVSEGTVMISGQTPDFDSLADDVVELRDNRLFSYASVENASSRLNSEAFFSRNDASVEFNISMDLLTGTGSK
jgi:Tfp pilus assembly PilM family ATPase